VRPSPRIVTPAQVRLSLWVISGGHELILFIARITHEWQREMQIQSRSRVDVGYAWLTAGHT